MASKLPLILVFICLAHVCLSARIPRAVECNKVESTEELTMEDVAAMQKSLSEVMTAKDAERFANVMRKFTKEASSAEKNEGAIDLFAMALAANSNKTESEWHQLLADLDGENDQKNKD